MTGYTSGYNYENVSKAILKGSNIFKGLLKLYSNVNSNVIDHALKEYSTVFLHSDENTNSREYELSKKKSIELENKIFSELNKTGFIDLLKSYEISTSIKEDNIHDGLTTVITGSENNLLLFKNNYKNEEDSTNYFLDYAKSPLETNPYVIHHISEIEQIELIYDDTSTNDIKRRYDAFLTVLKEIDDNKSFLTFTDGENSVESYCLKTIERSKNIADHDKRRILNVVNTLFRYKTAILTTQMKLIKILEVDCGNYYNHIIRSLI
jgi:phage gp36-like protein